MIKVKIIFGSTREKRNGEPVARYVAGLAGKRVDWDMELIDLRELDLPVFRSAVSPSAAQGRYEDPKVSAWSEKIQEADAFVIITTEHNHGYPAPLKDALDHLYHEWKRKPVGFVGYGGQLGGGRAVEQLRQVSAELHMADIRDAVYIPFVWEAFDGEGRPKNPRLEEAVERLFGELTWWAEALRAARLSSATQSPKA